MKREKTHTRKLFRTPRLKTILATAACALLYSAATAQPCKTDTLVLNTGYDYTTSPDSAVAAGMDDPEWQVIFVSNDVRNAHIAAGNPALPATPYPAVSANGGSGWASGTNAYPSHWISFANPASWYSTVQNGDYRVTFRRTFTLCDSASFNFDPQVARDNYISSMTVAGTSFYSDPAANWSNPANWQNLSYLGGISMVLPPGTYNIDITVNNWHPSGGSSSGANPHGLKFLCAMYTYDGTKAFRQNGFTTCDCPQEPCSDLCYWKVQGNNILNGNNIFGTLTNNDIKIKTFGNDRGIIKSGNTTTGGFLGWNTLNPTARLHVNCANGNPDENGLISDIRFENLEHGTGSILTIDQNGYVYNSGIGINSGNYWDLNGNSITAQNFLGTTNGQDLRIRTWNVQRAVMLAGATANSINSGFFGLNTTAPTARLHVNCANGNGEGGLSDVRFENLEAGSGTLLAIDAQGYVYDTRQTLPKGTGTSWLVTGNTITGGNNYFGTNSPDDVILRTSGSDKGILTSGMSGMPGDDGRLGWQTLNPTAHLHVNCAGGNPEDGGMGSDVRFEELEPGEGEILVIDPEGYVYNSHLRLTPDGTIEGGVKKMNDERVEKLENEVAELKAQINALLNCCSGATAKTDGNIPATTGSKLYQNIPNPFGKETTIEYDVKSMQQIAYIMIYDLNGREVSRFPIQNPGHGKISVNAENMISGVYMYSLVIDGQEIDSKRMILAK